jgi:hypothetical protein
MIYRFLEKLVWNFPKPIVFVSSSHKINQLKKKKHRSNWSYESEDIVDLKSTIFRVFS